MYTPSADLPLPPEPPYDPPLSLTSGTPKPFLGTRTSGALVGGCVLVLMAVAGWLVGGELTDLEGRGVGEVGLVVDGAALMLGLGVVAALGAAAFACNLLRRRERLWLSSSAA